MKKKTRVVGGSSFLIYFRQLGDEWWLVEWGSVIWTGPNLVEAFGVGVNEGRDSGGYEYPYGDKCKYGYGHKTDKSTHKRIKS